jgi:hypothetical protein
MKAFFTMTLSVPLWLVLLVVAASFAHISTLASTGVEKWREADQVAEKLAVCQTKAELHGSTANNNN